MMRTSFTIGDRELAYWRSPAPAALTAATPRPTILLLHGLGSDHEGLLPLADAWPGADVLAPDLPGFGRSDPVEDPQALYGCARDLAALCTELRLSEVVVVGHSLGATIALVLAAAFPHRLRAAILFSPVTSRTGVRTWPIQTYYAIGALLPRSAARLWFLSRLAIYLADRSTLTTRDRDLRRRILDADYRAAAQVSPQTIVQIYRGVRDTPFDALATRVHIPTVLVGARRDLLAPPTALAALAARIPHAVMRIIDRAGHLWPVEEPTAAGRLVAAEIAALHHG